MTNNTYAEHADERFVSTVKTIAQAIRDLADEFERDAMRTVPSTYANPRVSAVVRAVHTLNWGVANASVERAISDAVEADHAERMMQS